MSVPGFHAERALGKATENFYSAYSVGAVGGEVRPQLFCPPNSNECYQCWNEGGFSGCIVIHKPHPVLM